MWLSLILLLSIILIELSCTIAGPGASNFRIRPVSQYIMASNDSDENNTPTNPTLAAQTLVKALQDLIVRVVDLKQNNDMNQIHLGPEAGKLITALQEFFSSIITWSQPRTQNTITVSLGEEESKLDDPDDDAKFNHTVSESPSREDSLRKISSFESDGGDIEVNNSEHDTNSENPQPTVQQKLLTALREHVFNSMPIRLLYFEPQGESNFQVTLLERGAIYARLVSTLEGNIDDEELRPQIILQNEAKSREETEQEIIERLISKYAQYAILSHTWLRSTSGEVTYGDFNKGSLDTEGPGYRKLVNFCKAALKEHRLVFGWMDTICINKESSSELDESIRSMYNWYSRAAVCITYLAESATLSDMHADPWFTRGWTLQELLAPRVIKFYNGDWKQLIDSSVNDKEDPRIAKEVERATTITQDELWNIRKAPISRKMALAATRQVTREEDTSYSLMGIFDVSFSTAYGEGAQHAFSRLLQAILVSSRNVLDILNCAGAHPHRRPYNSRVLPFSPKHYAKRSSNGGLNLTMISPIEPLTLSHMGLRVPVILMPGLWIQDSISHNEYIGDYNASVHISPVGNNSDIPTTYNLLDNRISGRDGWKKLNSWFQITVAVFNFSDAADFTFLPKTCIGIALRCFGEAGKVTSGGVKQAVETKKPIVFKLNKTIAVSEFEEREWAWYIKTDELANHGMQLISLYL